MKNTKLNLKNFIEKIKVGGPSNWVSFYDKDSPFFFYNFTRAENDEFTQLNNHFSNLTAEEAVEAVENIEVKKEIYSSYFNEYFESEEEYGEFVLRELEAERVFNFAIYEKIEYFASVLINEEEVYSERHESEWFTDGLIKNIQNSIEDNKENFELLERELSFYQSIVEDIQPEDFSSFQELAFYFFNHDYWEDIKGSQFFSILRLTLLENGLDIEQLVFFEYIEDEASLEKLALKKELEETLEESQNFTAIKKTKI